MTTTETKTLFESGAIRIGFHYTRRLGDPFYGIRRYVVEGGFGLFEDETLAAALRETDGPLWQDLVRETRNARTDANNKPNRCWLFDLTHLSTFDALSVDLVFSIVDLVRQEVRGSPMSESRFAILLETEKPTELTQPIQIREGECLRAFIEPSQATNWLYGRTVDLDAVPVTSFSSSIGMNLNQAVTRACQEPSFLDALAWIAVWETERAVKQALEWQRTGISTAGHGGSHDTVFQTCFRAVEEQWTKPP